MLCRSWYQWLTEICFTFGGDPGINPIVVKEDAWGTFIPKNATINWTLAWGLQELRNNKVFFHAGNNGAFRSFFAYSPERDIGVAVMTNGANGLSFISDIFNPLTGDITPASVWWGIESFPEN